MVGGNLQVGCARLGLLGACALLALATVVPASALAGGGNSLNAKACQKNGWTKLVTSSGAPFANEEACVSYAAQGGVLKKPQTITFTSANPSPVTVGDPTYTPTATSTSGLPVAITLDATSTGCTLAGGIVTFTTVGTCVIDANQAGNATYVPAAQVQQSITVTKAAQTITFTSTNPTAVAVGGPPAALGGPGYTPTATATSGLPVAITLDATSTGCTLSSGLVSFTAAGTCVIDADQAGNGTYAPAPQVQQSITVSPGADVSLSAVRSLNEVDLSVTNSGPSTVTVTVVTTAHGAVSGVSDLGFGFGVPACSWSSGSFFDPTVTCVVTLSAGQTSAVGTWTAGRGGTWTNGVSEVTVANQLDPDSTPNNHLASEDDYLTFTVNVPG
jgi:hypothetical protein